MTQVGVGESIEGGGLILESGVGLRGRGGALEEIRRDERDPRGWGSWRRKLENRGGPQMVEGSASREKRPLEREEALEGRKGPQSAEGAPEGLVRMADQGPLRDEGTPEDGAPE